LSVCCLVSQPGTACTWFGFNKIFADSKKMNNFSKVEFYLIVTTNTTGYKKSQQLISERLK
jgi:hypothetical protein